MTLKQRCPNNVRKAGFGTILNNMTLKQCPSAYFTRTSFGTILNNMTLKHLLNSVSKTFWFWYHSKQHDSKTSENYFFSMIPYSHHLSIARFQFRRSDFSSRLLYQTFSFLAEKPTIFQWWFFFI